MTGFFDAWWQLFREFTIWLTILAAFIGTILYLFERATAQYADDSPEQTHYDGIHHDPGTERRRGEHAEHPAEDESLYERFDPRMASTDDEVARDED